MTAPDPRVGEIEARYQGLATPQQAHLLSPKINGTHLEMWMIEDGDENEIGYVHSESNASRILNAPDDVAYLLAELRDRDEKLARVEELHKPVADWDHSTADLCSECYGDTYPCSTIKALRAAVAAAGGGGDL